MLTVSTLPDFAYFPDIVLSDEGGAPAIWHIVITDYVIIALLRFLAADHDGPVVFACVNPQMGRNGRSFLVPSPACLRQKVDAFDFFENIRTGSFDPVASLITYSRSSKIDWAWVDPTHC